MELGPLGVLVSDRVNDFGDRFIPFRQENAGYVPTCFVIQHDEINSSFEPAEQILPV
jgi:hypothetical protein